MHQAPLDPVKFLREVADVARQRSWEIDQIGTEGVPMIALRRECSPDAPAFYASAGVHGDEPAPIYGMKRFIEEAEYPDNLTLHFVPLVNPNGMVLGTRDNPDGIDINRDYKHLRSAEARAHLGWIKAQNRRYATCFCLHEDYEATGSYLYEVRDDGVRSFAPEILKIAERLSGLDLSTEIDGRPSHQGLILPVDRAAMREDLPEALYLFDGHTGRCHTFETASESDLATRVTTQFEVLKAAVEMTAADAADQGA